MKVILIQGKANTGKTTLCNRIDEWLQRYIFQDIPIVERIEMTKHYSKRGDFLAVYDIFCQTKTKITKRILINSGTEKDCITPFEKFYKNKDQKGISYYKKDISIDLLITAIHPSKEKGNNYDKIRNILGKDLIEKAKKIETESFGIRNKIRSQEVSSYVEILEEIKGIFS